MTKSELIASLSRETGYVKTDIKAIIEKAISLICKALVDEEKVYLTKLGILEPYVRKGLVRHHPVTRKAVKIGDRTAISFRAASGLKRKLNK